MLDRQSVDAFVRLCFSPSIHWTLVAWSGSLAAEVCISMNTWSFCEIHMRFAIMCVVPPHRVSHSLSQPPLMTHHQSTAHPQRTEG